MNERGERERERERNLANSFPPVGGGVVNAHEESAEKASFTSSSKIGT